MDMMNPISRGFQRNQDPQRFTITYVGTLSDNYPVEGLIPALKTVQDSGVDFILQFVGTVSEKTRKLLKSQIS